LRHQCSEYEDHLSEVGGGKEADRFATEQGEEQAVAEHACLEALEQEARRWIGQARHARSKLPDQSHQTAGDEYPECQQPQPSVDIDARKSAEQDRRQRDRSNDPLQPFDHFDAEKAGFAEDGTEGNEEKERKKISSQSRHVKSPSSEGQRRKHSLKPVPNTRLIR